MNRLHVVYNVMSKSRMGFTPEYIHQGITVKDTYSL